jgi:predicted PolB exonuclease-like 3'-5' exonuclease
MEGLIEHKLQHTLVIDIETIPDGEKLSVEEMMTKAPKTMSKEETIRKWAHANIDEEFRKRSLNSLLGRLFCVGLKFNDEPVHLIKYNEDESKMIDELGEYIKKLGHHIHTSYIIGHNLLGFDWPWIMQRAFKYQNATLINTFPTHRQDKRLRDTNTMFTLGVYGAYVKLDDMCKFLGIETPKDGVDGSMVYDLFLKGEFDKIYEYCPKDVEATYQCFYSMLP